MTVDRPDQHWQDTQPSAPLDRRQLAGYAALGAVGAALMIAAWLADLSWLLFVLGLALLLASVVGALILAASHRLPPALDRRFRVVGEGDDEQPPTVTPWPIGAVASALAARASSGHVVSASSNAIRLDVLDPGGSASGQGVLLFALRPGTFRLNRIRQQVDWAGAVPAAVTPLALVSGDWQGKAGKASPTPSVASDKPRDQAVEPEPAATPRRGLTSDEVETPMPLVDPDTATARRRALEELDAVEPNADDALRTVLAETLQEAGWRAPALADPENRITAIVVGVALLVWVAWRVWLFTLR